MPTLGIFVLSVLLIVVIVLVSMVHNRFKLKQYIQELKKKGRFIDCEQVMGKIRSGEGMLLFLQYYTMPGDSVWWCPEIIERPNDPVLHEQFILTGCSYSRLKKHIAYDDSINIKIVEMIVRK
jgi:hypothetical protein